MKHTRPIAALAGVALLAGVWLVLRSSAGEPPAAPDPVRPTPVARSSGSGPAPSTGPSDSEPVAVAELGAPADADAPARKCSLASGQEPDCEFLAPDQDTLLDMARCGVARLDVPHSPPPGSGLDMFPAPWRELAGVGEAEHAELEAAASAYLAAQRARLSELAVSVGIQREWSDATVPAVVVTRITAEFEPEQVAAAIDRVARERAGLEPDDGLELPPTLEQVIRLRLDTGDRSRPRSLRPSGRPGRPSSEPPTTAGRAGARTSATTARARRSRPPSAGSSPAPPPRPRPA